MPTQQEINESEETKKEIRSTQSLILKHRQRLQILREKEAQAGYSTDPVIITEIEDIGNELTGLEDELARQEYQLKRLESPVVYIRNFGVSSAPENAHRLEWADGFVSSPRSVPQVEAWQDLPDKLNRIKNAIGKTGLIRLEGQMALTSAILFGATFKDVGRYQLEVAQYNPSAQEIEYWCSDPLNPQTTGLNVRHLSGNPTAADAALVIYAVPKKSITNILRSVEQNWNETDTFSTGKPGEHLKGLLSIEAQPALNGENLTPAQAASLAQQSSRLVSDFVANFQPKVLHLFMAVPVGLAVFLGHRWNMLTPVVQCYEFVQVGDKAYVPSCKLTI